MPKAKVCTKESQLEKIHHQPGEDIKPDNYGYLGKRLVCIDYAYHRIHPFNEKFGKYLTKEYKTLLEESEKINDQLLQTLQGH